MGTGTVFFLFLLYYIRRRLLRVNPAIAHVLDNGNAGGQPERGILQPGERCETVHVVSEIDQVSLFSVTFCCCRKGLRVLLRKLLRPRCSLRVKPLC